MVCYITSPKKGLNVTVKQKKQKRELQIWPNCFITFQGFVERRCKKIPAVTPRLSSSHWQQLLLRQPGSHRQKSSTKHMGEMHSLKDETSISVLDNVVLQLLVNFFEENMLNAKYTKKHVFFSLLAYLQIWCAAPMRWEKFLPVLSIWWIKKTQVDAVSFFQVSSFISSPSDINPANWKPSLQWTHTTKHFIFIAIQQISAKEEELTTIPIFRTPHLHSYLFFLTGFQGTILCRAPAEHRKINHMYSLQVWNTRPTEGEIYPLQLTEGIGKTVKNK